MKNMKDNKKVEKLDEEVQKLALAIDKVEDEKLILINQLKKALADYSNLERDLEKRLGIRGDQIKIDLAKSLLKVMDDIYFALENAKDIQMNGQVRNWAEGIKAILFDVKKALEDFGVTEINVSKGDKFDSLLHEAVTSVKGGEKNTIFEIMQPGFALKDMIIRPVRVVISLGD